MTDHPHHRSGRLGRPLAMFLLASLAGVPLAHAAVPEPPPAATSAPADSAGLLPPGLHPWVSAGLGWIAAPQAVRRRHQVGQGLALGLEVRPRPAVRLRAGAEYQTLPAVSRVQYQFIGYTFEGIPVPDTLSLDVIGRGWIGSGRIEAQWRALPRLWLLAGGGRGYFSPGLRAYHFASPSIEVDVDFPGSSGWAWIASTGARLEFDVFGPTLDAEVRWDTLLRRQDTLRGWTLRVGWQAPRACAPAAQRVRSRTSRATRSRNAASGMAPRSPSPLRRTDTVPASASRGPTTSM